MTTRPLASSVVATVTLMVRTAGGADSQHERFVFGLRSRTRRSIVEGSKMRTSAPALGVAAPHPACASAPPHVEQSGRGASPFTHRFPSNVHVGGQVGGGAWPFSARS